MKGINMNRELYVNADKLIDMLENIQDMTDNIMVSLTIDETIDIIYFLVEEGKHEQGI